MYKARALFRALKRPTVLTPSHILHRDSCFHPSTAARARAQYQLVSVIHNASSWRPLYLNPLTTLFWRVRSLYRLFVGIDRSQCRSPPLLALTVALLLPISLPPQPTNPRPQSNHWSVSQSFAPASAPRNQNPARPGCLPQTVSRVSNSTPSPGRTFSFSAAHPAKQYIQIQPIPQVSSLIAQTVLCLQLALLKLFGNPGYEPARHIRARGAHQRMCSLQMPHQGTAAGHRFSLYLFGDAFQRNPRMKRTRSDRS